MSCEIPLSFSFHVRKMSHPRLLPFVNPTACTYYTLFVSAPISPSPSPGYINILRLDHCLPTLSLAPLKSILDPTTRMIIWNHDPVHVTLLFTTLHSPHCLYGFPPTPPSAFQWGAYQDTLWAPSASGSLLGLKTTISSTPCTLTS